MDMPTCREDMACHSQERICHHGLGLHGEVQLASHVAVHTGPDLLQLIPCMGTWEVRHLASSLPPQGLPDLPDSPTPEKEAREALSEALMGQALRPSWLGQWGGILRVWAVSAW